MITEIYVQGATKNPARLKTARAKWSIVCVLNNETIQRRDGTVCINNATTKRAVLTALSQALGRFNKAAVLKIYISDDFVRNSLANGWTQRWKNNNWHKIRLNGELIHEDLWRQIQGQLSAHAVTFAGQSEIENILKQEEKNGKRVI